MKKILNFLFPILSFSLAVSCEKTDPVKPDTTYTVTMAMPTTTAASSVQYDLTAYEFNEDGEKVANNSIDRAVSGQAKTFTANPRAVKVKLYIKMYSDAAGVSAQYLWVQQVFYLEEGKNIEIKVEDHTKVGKTEP